MFSQLRDHFPDASILVFNFREGEGQSQMAKILSEYDMTIMDYPRHFEGVPVLKMEVIHHFLRSCESWLLLGHQNVLLIHCERGGWPVLAFMLAALLLYRKQYIGEQRTLDMVYKQAPWELLHLLSPLNPVPSQLRYLQYVSRRSVVSEWPPVNRELVLDCIILRFIPDFDRYGGCRPIFRIYGQDSVAGADQATKVLYSTPKRNRLIRAYKQQESEIIKIDINCRVQGDIVVECISLHDDMEREEMMFRFMFNTAFIRSNILILNRDEIDVLWNSKDQFPKDFRAEILFSKMDATTSVVVRSISCFEEKEGLPEEAFSKVQEIFSNVDWLDIKSDATLNVVQQMGAPNIVHDKSGTDSPKNTEAELLKLRDISPKENQPKQKPAKLENNSKRFIASIKIDLLPCSPKQSTIIDASKKEAKPQKELPASVATNQSLHPQVGNIKPSEKDNGLPKSMEVSHQMNASLALSLAISPVSKSVESKSDSFAPLTPLQPDLIRPDVVSNTIETLPSQPPPPPPLPSYHFSTSKLENSSTTEEISTVLQNGTQGSIASPICVPGTQISSTISRNKLPMDNENSLSIQSSQTPFAMPPPPPTPTPPPPPTPPLRVNISVRGRPPPPPPPPVRPQNPSSVPPPPPPVPTFSSKQSNSLTQNSSCIPSPPPPPAPLFKGVSKTPSPTRTLSTSNSGKGRLSRTMSSKSSNKKLKPLHWMKLTRANQGSLWAEAKKFGAIAPEIDMSELENLFSATLPISAHGRKSFKRNSVGSKTEKVQLLDHRRAYNCEIMLSKVKVPLHVLMDSVLSLEDSILDADHVENLIKFCPTQEEMEILKGYTGEKENLGRCEQFFFGLMQVPRVECKLRVFSFKIRFHSQLPYRSLIFKIASMS
ncbi:formin-like protein 13 isoform X6 [Morus notabilis]|uniref:formin-like protein 13 isoform X6 n=1 Tax=Morus notabilis TaxID=981085 RepID=UPI000CECE8E5|nr:formin-like protein 13 isoform X6 [Morus notabilis]